MSQEGLNLATTITHSNEMILAKTAATPSSNTPTVVVTSKFQITINWKRMTIPMVPKEAHQATQRL